MLRRISPALLAALLLPLAMLAAQHIYAATIEIPPGDEGHCSTVFVGTTSTSAPCAPVVAGQPCPASVHDTAHWHPPVHALYGCYHGHEHGDAPPEWAGAVGFDHSGGFHGSTSGAENVQKHPAMKGFLLVHSNGVQVYFRYHAASNPADRGARYHSYQIFAKDTSGVVSHWQGWYDVGDPTNATFRPTQKAVQGGTFPRNVIIGVDHASWSAGFGTEQWYGLTSTFGWDFGISITNPSAFFAFPETVDYDVSHWDLVGPTRLGQTRRIEMSFYRDVNTGKPRGNQAPQNVVFYATQFGELVSGPSDPRCGGAILCLDQYIASSLPQVAFPGNAAQKNFNAPGLLVPN